jgi:hypothetical protein
MITNDPSDPRLTRGADTEPTPQADAYLVSSGLGEFVRPERTRYVHTVCGSVTTMARAIAETYARNPAFYGATYCVHCRMHRPVGADGEFVWADDTGSKVGT